MDEKKVTNHYHFADLGLGVYMVLVLVGVGLVILGLGVSRGNPWAIALAAVLGTLILTGIGFLASEFARSRAAKQEVERSKVERIRDLDNIKENLAMMEAQSRAQLVQGRAQTEGWKTVERQVRTQNLLAGGNHQDEPEGIVFDDSLFDELDEVD